MEQMTIHKQEKIEELRRLIGKTPCRIAIISHVNPDGDAVGSGIAWLTVLRQLGHDVKFIVPNAPPQFLDWMSGSSEVRSFKNKADEYGEFIDDCDLIFCMDFNQINRLEGLGEHIENNMMATKVLIDHHQEPPAIFDLAFSEVSASSTCYLLYTIINALGYNELINQTCAEALYVGIMTDTGNFSFSNITADLFDCTAELVRRGVNVPKINNAVYNNYSEDRLRLLGYVLNDKMTILDDFHAAYMTLSQEELHRYNFKPGDSEGFVNYPLSIKHIRISAIFIETLQCVKVSLRSQGDFDVNVFARKYFNGGGHKNASGGKSMTTLEEAVQAFEHGLREHFSHKG